MSKQIEETDEYGFKEVYSLNAEGRRQGLYRWYYPNGQLRVECTYKDGLKNGLYSSFHENGQPWEECSFEEGEYEGLYQSFWSNGKLREKRFYENGTLQGPYEARWYEGSIAERCIFKDADRDGLGESFDESGKPTSTTVYREGVKLSGETAEKYLSSWKEKRAKETKEHHEKVIATMKERLKNACDVKTKPVGKASTPERKELAESATVARRKRDILVATLQKVLAGGDGRILSEMQQTVDLKRQDELQKKAYQRLSDDDKALIAEIIQATRITRDVLDNKFNYFRMLVRNKKARRG